MDQDLPAVDPELGAVLGRFFERSHRVEPHRLVDLIVDAAHLLGATGVEVRLADHEQRALVHLSADDAMEPLPIEGTAAGRCFTTSQVVEHPGRSTQPRWWFPLLDGVDRIGAMAIDAPALHPPRRRAFIHLASAATAEIIARGQYSDLFTILRRRRPMTLAAELQWQQLPPASFTTVDVAVSGMLEPAYDVGGDAFDYAHSEGRLEVAILDAVGHDLGSSLISTLAVGAYRNARRAGLSLRRTAEAMDEAMLSQLPVGSFATGQIGSLDTAAGTFRWLNAGHPLPLLLRDGHAHQLEARPRPPFGIADLPPPSNWWVAEHRLQPGDALLLYTDGVIEARREGGHDFGIERLIEFVHTAASAAVTPHETLRRLSHAIIDFHDGRLQDDATTLLVTWRPEGR